MCSLKTKGVVMSLMVHPFFDSETCSYSYAVVSPESRTCAIIDAVLNFDLSTGKSTTTSADDLIEFVEANDLRVEWIFETHIHADHLSAAAYLKQKFVHAQTAIGAEVVKVQEHFSKLFDVGCEVDGRQFDRLLADNDRIWLGGTCGRVIHTPGHTAACVTYLFGDVAFVGDTLFMPDYGTARCDFPGGDARALYQSIQKILALPDDTRLFMCHDYAPNGRGYRFLSSVAEEKRCNIHIRAGRCEDSFLSLRTTRDAGLAAPRLMVPSLRTNICGGMFPAPPAPALPRVTNFT
jgi:glyoxylase-like metal-dependent hydrolase (beta-lactamase superfamily II)